MIPNCTYIVMPGGGHGFEGEQLVQQAELNVNFVKTVFKKKFVKIAMDIFVLMFLK